MTKRLLPALLFFLTGCATIIQGSSQKLLITSDPPGAVVSVDGVPVGAAPVIATVARRKPHTLSAALEGYVGDPLTIAPKASGGLLLLSLLTVYGLPVDLITGAHMSFAEDHVRLTIAPRDSVSEGATVAARTPRPPVPIGARIRLRHTDLVTPAVTVGMLRGFASDTLHVESGPPSALLHRIPLSATQSIDMSMGSARAQSAGRWAGRGALYGLGLGVLTGAIIGFSDGSDGGMAAIFLGGFGLMGGGAGGALLGAVAGQSDRWVNVPCCTTAPATPPAATAPTPPARSGAANRP